MTGHEVNSTFETGDVVVGVLAAVGVVILIIVFVWLFRQVMLKKE